MQSRSQNIKSPVHLNLIFTYSQWGWLLGSLDHAAVIPYVVNEWVNYESCTQVLTSFCQSRSIPDQVV